MATVHRTREWHRTRRIAQQHLPLRCSSCDVDGRYIRLELHHKLPVCRGGGVHDMDNLEWLCTQCHRKTHRKLDRESDAVRRRELDLLLKEIL